VIVQLVTILELSVKSQNQGARTVSFGIIGHHQTHNWEWKFYKAKFTGTQTSFSTNFGGKLSFILSFLFPERPSTAATYIFTAPTRTTTIITLEPCALNAEFQHFILRFNTISLLCRYHRERERIGGESRPKDRVKAGWLYG
jgi:hypothetical protein